MRYYTHKLLFLPLLGFLAAGCSTSSNLQTSEADDVYFSSSDKVTYVEPLPQEQATEAYASEDGDRDVSERVSDPETYAQRRDNRRNDTPYQYSYYDAPFGNPYWAYATPFYSPSRYYSRAMYMDPWMDPWYDPFYGPSMALYDPFWPRAGVSFNIGIGFGRFYNPWGYGYGYAGYGGYGHGYNPYRHYSNNYYGDRVIANRVAYGRRDDRSSNAGGSRNPNISRDGRGNVVSGNSRTGNVVSSQPGEINRSRSSNSQASPQDGQQQPRRRQIVTPSGEQNQGRGTTTTPTRTRSSNSETAPPVRRQRTDYTPAQPTETRSRSYEPAPTRTYEAPSRSSSEGNSSSGSSSGGGRRGRN